VSGNRFSKKKKKYLKMTDVKKKATVVRSDSQTITDSGSGSANDSA
jgi:hypothetical protein